MGSTNRKLVMWLGDEVHIPNNKYIFLFYIFFLLLLLLLYFN